MSTNITCTITNNGENEVQLRGNRDDADIFDNNHLTFRIQDSNGNIIEREGGIHGIGELIILYPGENITVVANLNEYYPLENLTGEIYIQAFYTSGDNLDDHGSIPFFDGTLESEKITLSPID